ncbi:MAG: hypothetical protein ACXABI_09315 [Candidatus Hodarchaeales archaeon]|jgi:hypothetical protein
MSWEEIDKLLRKLFDVEAHKQEKIVSNQEKIPNIPSDFFKTFLDRHIQESHDLEIFDKNRFICLYCSERITDDKYVVVTHPEFPNNYLKQLYFHSKGDCDPRYRFLEYSRKKWLREYRYAGNFFKLKEKKQKNIFHRIKEKIF